MGNYGKYGFKSYNNKKGKRWFQRKNNNPYRKENDQYSFVYNKALYLEQLESTGYINETSGLLPYAFIPKNLRTGYTSEYFAIKTFEDLDQSLFFMFDIPFHKYDIITPFHIPVIVDSNNVPLYRESYYNAIVTRDNIAKKYLYNNIIAFCFEYVLPNFLFNLQIYTDIINTICSTINFRDRAMIIRTDITNHRILFMVSNITEDPIALEKYEMACENFQKDLYVGNDILFTKHPNLSYEELSANIKCIVDKYISELIKKH